MFQMPMHKLENRSSNCLRQMGRKKRHEEKAVLLMQQALCEQPHASLKQHRRYDYHIYLSIIVSGEAPAQGTIGIRI